MANIQQIQANSVNYPIAGYQFDGEWVSAGGEWSSTSYVDLKGNITTIAANGIKVIDLSAILPPDGKPYMVSLQFDGNTTSTSGNYFTAHVAAGERSDYYASGNKIPWVRFCETRTRTSSTRAGGGMAQIPLSGTQRKITICVTGKTCTVVTLTINAYKRLGTNT